jgi:hypothetical protein
VSTVYTGPTFTFLPWKTAEGALPIKRGLPTRLSISTSVSIVNLAVFLLTTSDTRGRETIKISAASACFKSSWRRTLLNNGEAKAPNGDNRPFRRFRAESAAPASKWRLLGPACLALWGYPALTNRERKFVANKWLPGPTRRTRLRRRFYRL